MDKDFFIIMNHPSGGYIPLVNEEGEMFFETEEEARSTAENNFWASKNGLWNIRNWAWIITNKKRLK